MIRHDENGVLLTDQQVYDSLLYRMQRLAKASSGTQPFRCRHVQLIARQRAERTTEFAIYTFGSGRHSIISTDWPGKITKCG